MTKNYKRFHNTEGSIFFECLTPYRVYPTVSSFCFHNPLPILWPTTFFWFRSSIAFRITPTRWFWSRVSVLISWQRLSILSFQTADCELAVAADALPLLFEEVCCCCCCCGCCWWLLLTTTTGAFTRLFRYWAAFTIGKPWPTVLRSGPLAITLPASELGARITWLLPCDTTVIGATIGARPANWQLAVMPPSELVGFCCWFKVVAPLLLTFCCCRCVRVTPWVGVTDLLAVWRETLAWLSVKPEIKYKGWKMDEF